MRAKRLIFLDLNLIADSAYAKELFTALIPLRVQWGGLATTTIAWDDELLDLAARSGCRGLLIGFESLNQASLLETKKAFNMRRSYYEVVRKIRERKIALMGCFVFGFDHDSLSTFDETVDFVLESKMDLPRYAIAVPFPGTALYKRLKAEGRITTENWSLYDGQHVVFEPKQMSASDLLERTRPGRRLRLSNHRAPACRIADWRPISIPANLDLPLLRQPSRRSTFDWFEGRPMPRPLAIVQTHADRHYGRAALTSGLNSQITALRKLRPSRGLAEIGFFVLLWIAGIALGLAGLDTTGAWQWPLRLAGILTAGLALNAFFLLSHDGHHRLLFRNARVNHAANVLLCIPLLHSPSAYRVLH
jgi:hypothetical protein